MPRRLTIEEFIEKARIVHGDKYDYSLVEYAKSSINVKIICPVHGIFEQTPNSHTQGSGCPVCVNGFSGTAGNTSEFIDKAISVHDNKYDYSLVEYIGCYNKVKIICKTHGIFEQTPNSHTQGRGCAKCAYEIKGIDKRTSIEEFIEKASIKHEGKYDYSSVDQYTSTDIKVKITCKVHGFFEQTPHSHLRGTGCPICGTESTSSILTSNTDIFIKRANKIHDNRYDYSLVKYIGCYDKIKIVCGKHGIFEQAAYSHLNGQGCGRCSNTVSSQEDFIFDNINIESERSNRTILDGLELDILYPHHNIAVEVDGIYWHSDGGIAPKDKSYHLDKTNECEEKEIQLLHFWDIEIDKIPEIVLSVIKNKLGITENKIYARKCSIKSVTYADSKLFLNENHMQGAGAIGSIRYGLYFNDELVSLMTFGLSRYNKNYEYELIRFCNKINTSVVGGASRLFKHSNLNSVVSYANRRWSDGGLYKTLGFEYLHTSKPNFVYAKGHKIYSRQTFQKHKLKDILENFDKNITAEQNMKNAGYNKVFDCGNMVFGYSK